MDLPRSALREVGVGWQERCSLVLKGEIDMLGLGLLGTIIVIAVVVWLIRRV